MSEEKLLEDKVEEKEGFVVEEESKGLSLRDALDVAMQATKVEKEEPEPTSKAVESPTSENVEPPAKEDTGLQPPAEWDAEDKGFFLESSRKQQEAAIKLHNKRQAGLADLRAAAAEKKAAAQEYETYKKLADEVAPYLKAVGDKRSPYEAITLALKMRNEFETGDPRIAAAAYLKAKGVPVPKDLEIQDARREEDEKLSPLQQRLAVVESRLAREDQAHAQETLGNAWSSFEQVKNAAGKNKFPDLADPVSGSKLASNIGTLVRGDTLLSQQFIANARERIPDLNYTKLLTEAYRYCGGKVDESEAPRSQASQTQIVKSRRAAASVPGRTTQNNSSTSGKKYSTYREAAKAAYDEIYNN